MLNKRLGAVIVVVSIIISIIIFLIIGRLNTIGRELGCYPQTSDCMKVEKFLSFSHIVVGVMAFFFSLGIYLILFSKGEERILKRLEDEKNKSLNEEKFIILLKGLDEYEKQALKIVREQPGITQATIRFKLNLSKAKVSEVVSGLEKKKIVRRKEDGKTFKLYFAEGF